MEPQEAPSYDQPESGILEFFPNPHEDLEYQVKFSCEIFTCLHPTTGKPDFAQLEFLYVPDERCVDVASLSRYLLAYRQEKITVEAAAGRIVKDFTQIIDPRQMRLEATFMSREGIEVALVVTWPPEDEEDEDDPDYGGLEG